MGRILHFDNKFEILVFFYAFTCILEVFRIKAGPITLNISDLSFVLLFIYLLFHKRKKSQSASSKETKVYWKLLFFILLCTLNFLVPVIDEFWENTGINGAGPALKYSLKNLFNLIFIYLLLRQDSEKKRSFYKQVTYGFLAACVFHIGYSSYQLIEWYLFGEDIHTPFLNSFGLTEDTLGHPLTNFVIYPVLRATGLYWDAYYMGFVGGISLFCILFIKNKTIRFTCLFITLANWLMSLSRTGYLGAIAMLFAIFIYKQRNKTLRKLINYKKIIITGGLICIVALIIISFYISDDIVEMVSETFKYKNSYKSDDDGDMRHALYPVYALEAVLRDPFHFLFGYGARNCSRGIFLTGNILDFVSTKESFDIESDWCKMLLDFGVPCFVAYIYFNIKLIVKVIRLTNYRKSLIGMFYTVTLINIFTCGFVYCMNDSRWVWIIYAASIFYIEDRINTIKKHTLNRKYGIKNLHQRSIPDTEADRGATLCDRTV